MLTWDGAADALTLDSEVPCGGRHPRDLELTADERFLVVANQWSDQIAVLALDHRSGRGLTTVDVVATPSPACVLRAT